MILFMETNKKNHRFRCQYQKGKLCISHQFTSDTPISYEDVIISLASLAIKVRDEIGDEVAGKVALRVLRIHHHIIMDMYPTEHCGHGESKSYYLDLQDKNKEKRTERIDVQLWGQFKGGELSHPLRHYVELYRANTKKLIINNT